MYITKQCFWICTCYNFLFKLIFTQIYHRNSSLLKPESLLLAINLKAFLSSDSISHYSVTEYPDLPPVFLWSRYFFDHYYIVSAFTPRSEGYNLETRKITLEFIGCYARRDFLYSSTMPIVDIPPLIGGYRAKFITGL